MAGGERVWRGAVVSAGRPHVTIASRGRRAAITGTSLPGFRSQSALPAAGL